jgi:hypothetical protein
LTSNFFWANGVNAEKDRMMENTKLLKSFGIAKVLGTV